MAKDSDNLAGSFETENTGGLLSGLLAEEDEFDRRALWRLGSWGVASVGAVIVAMLANQSSIGMRREQIAAADLARQAQQIQSVAKESQNETRRLASAIDTLNGDRDRLYSRVTVLEQGLDSVTGAIARQNSAVTPAASRSVADCRLPPAAEPRPLHGREPTSATASRRRRRRDGSASETPAAPQAAASPVAAIAGRDSRQAATPPGR